MFTDGIGKQCAQFVHTELTLGEYLRGPLYQEMT